MGRVLDFFMSKDWETFQRVGLYKKLGKLADKIAESPKELEGLSKQELIELVKNLAKKK